MKLLLLVILVSIVVWMVRSRARPLPPAAPPPAPREALRESMVACAQCGLHLPESDALPGRGGAFCGEAHRTAYERAHPAP